MVIRDNWEKWTRVVVATARNVRTVMARVSFVLSPKRILDAVPVQLVVQGLEADPQHLGRTGLVVSDRGQGLQDQRLFRLLDGRADGKGDGVGTEDDRLPGETRRQVGRRDEVALAGDDGALDGVPQLPDVPRPRMPQEDLLSRLTHGPDLLVVLAVEFLDESLDQQRDVLSPLPERGEGDHEDVQSIVEVFPERPLPH